MAKQWVDITTIDNVTPFMKVRWRYAFGSGDRWFSEASGLTTDNMSWGNGDTAALGYFGGHRMNNNSYTCGFQCDQTGIDTGLQPNVYRSHVKDASRNNSAYYDSTVVINSETYYEVDFSLWDGASGKKLYAPYSNTSSKWNVGDIYVEVEEPSSGIYIDKTGQLVPTTGGSFTVNVTSSEDWTATPSDSWITVSPSSGESGVTAVTVTIPQSYSLSARTGTVSFAIIGDSKTLSITQSAYVPICDTGITIGTSEMQAARLGTTEVEAIYFGSTLLYSLPEPYLTISPRSLYFDENTQYATVTIDTNVPWTAETIMASISLSPSSGTTGATMYVYATTPVETETGSISITASSITSSITVTNEASSGEDGVKYLDLFGAVNIETDFNPYQIYNDGNYIKTELAAKGIPVSGLTTSNTKTYAMMLPNSNRDYTVKDITWSNSSLTQVNGSTLFRSVINSGNTSNDYNNPWTIVVDNLNAESYFGDSYASSKTLSSYVSTDANVIVHPTGSSGATSAYTRFYYLKVWGANDELLHNYVPYANFDEYMLDPDDIRIGIKDLVTGNLFSASPSISGMDFSKCSYGIETIDDHIDEFYLEYEADSQVSLPTAMTATKRWWATFSHTFDNGVGTMTFNNFYYLPRTDYSFNGASITSVKTVGAVHIECGSSGQGGAFSGCTSLEKVELGNGVQWLSGATFGGCTSLKEVSFGKTLQFIAADQRYTRTPFTDCSSLDTIVFSGLTPPGCFQYGASCSTIFNGVNSTGTIYVPSEAVYVYQEWKSDFSDLDLWDVMPLEMRSSSSE